MFKERVGILKNAFPHKIESNKTKRKAFAVKERKRDSKKP